MPDEDVTLEQVNCSVCGADHNKPLFTVEGFTIVKCLECDNAYVNPRLSEKNLNDVYGEVYQPEHLTNEDPRRDKVFRRYLAKLMEYKKSGKLLELGCGGGHFLRLAKESGFEIYGIEISDYLAGFCGKKLQTDTISSKVLQEASYDAEYFDAVVSFNVFSHLLDPVEEFKHIKRVLKPGGVLLFETGNIDGASTLFKQPPFLEKAFWGSPKAHHQKLATKTLSILLSRAGLNLKELLFYPKFVCIGDLGLFPGISGTGPRPLWKRALDYFQWNIGFTGKLISSSMVVIAEK